MASASTTKLPLDETARFIAENGERVKLMGKSAKVLPPHPIDDQVEHPPLLDFPETRAGQFTTPVPGTLERREDGTLEIKLELEPPKE